MPKHTSKKRTKSALPHISGVKSPIAVAREGTSGTLRNGKSRSAIPVGALPRRKRGSVGGSLSVEGPGSARSKNAVLRKLGAKHKPAQEWYEEDMAGLF